MKGHHSVPKRQKSTSRTRFPIIPVLPAIVWLLLTGCQFAAWPDGEVAQSLPKLPVHPDAIPDAVPQAEPLSAQGNGPQLEIGGRRFQIMDRADGYVERGQATWHPTRSHGQPTANGEIHDMYRATAANNTLPIPSYARVTSLHSRRSIIVRINDRSAMEEGQIIRLSLAAAAKLRLEEPANRAVEVRGLPTPP